MPPTVFQEKGAAGLNKIKTFFRATRAYLFVAIVSIAFYELLENFSVIRGIVNKIIGVLTPILLGIAVAYIVNLVATVIFTLFFKKRSDKIRGVGKTVSNVSGIVIVFGIWVLLSWLVIPKVIDSIRLLILNFETYYSSIVDWAVHFWENLNLNQEVTARAVEISETLLAKIQEFITALIPKLLNYTFDAVGVIANILLSLVFSIYLLFEKEKLLAHMRRFIRACLSQEKSEKFLKTCTLANTTFRGYFSGQLVSCSIIGLLCYIGMRIFSMPLPEMISVFIAVFALIPILGPWLSTVPSAFIILMMSPDRPALVLWFVALVIIIQQIDNNFVYPHVVGGAIGLSSVWVLGAIVIGGGLFGFIGLLLAVPTTAVIYRLISDWTNARAKQKGIPIVDSIPEVAYDLRGHKLKRKRKKDKKNEPGENHDEAEKSSD